MSYCKVTAECRGAFRRRRRRGSPGVDGVAAVAGQRLGGGSGVHVAGVGPSGRGRLWGVMLLHGGHGGPRAGALGSSCSPFLLIGTAERKQDQDPSR